MISPQKNRLKIFKLIDSFTLTIFLRWSSVLRLLCAEQNEMKASQ